VLLKHFLLDEFRLLTFRAPSAAMRQHRGGYLALGLLVTWLAGVGRYWDSPNALPWQYAGLSSLSYVFLLALVIWAVILPLGARNWSYRNVLLFVTLTVPPALLYAIPVELFLPLSAAHGINSAFLAIVASWRVTLLAGFLVRVAGLGGFTLAVGLLTPLAITVDVIALMGLEHVVYANMVGLRDPENAEAGDGIANFLCQAAGVLTPFLIAGYARLVWLHKSRAGTVSVGGLIR